VRPGHSRIFDGEKEAKLIALACSKPPKGRTRWTLRLLENKVVELEIRRSRSDSTIGRVLKKRSQAHRRQQMGHPAEANSAFVAAMEDVLAVYTRPRDPDCPLVCLDETSKQLIAETRVPIPMKPGRRPVAITNTNATALPTCSCCLLRSKAGATSKSPIATPPWTTLTSCGIGRCPLRRLQNNRTGPGQSQHPLQGIAL